MRKLLKKDVKWEWTKEINDDFEQLKKEIPETPCLAHFDPKKDNFITTDACNTGLGATLWQKENKHSDRWRLPADFSPNVNENMP